jgi:hypothetical protein
MRGVGTFVFLTEHIFAIGVKTVLPLTKTKSSLIFKSMAFKLRTNLGHASK